MMIPFVENRCRFLLTKNGCNGSQIGCLKSVFHLKLKAEKKGILAA